MDRSNPEQELVGELADLRLLRDISTLLIHENNPAMLYERIVEAAVALTHADAADLQAYDTENDKLVLLASLGMPDQPASALTTPLISRFGRPIGLISTQWAKPHAPTEREHQLLDVLGRQAADLIERMQTEAALAHKMEELERVNRNLEDFTHIVSHDLRAPMRKVVSFGDMLKMKINAGESATTYVDHIQETARHAIDMMKSLLSYAHITSPKQQVEMVDMNRVVEQVTSDLDIRIQEKQAEIRKNPLPIVRALPTNVSSAVQLDRQRAPIRRMPKTDHRNLGVKRRPIMDLPD